MQTRVVTECSAVGCPSRLECADIDGEVQQQEAARSGWFVGGVLLAEKHGEVGWTFHDPDIALCPEHAPKLPALRELTEHVNAKLGLRCAG